MVLEKSLKMVAFLCMNPVLCGFIAVNNMYLEQFFVQPGSKLSVSGNE